MSQFRNSVFHHISSDRDNFQALDFSERKRLAFLYFKGCSDSRRIDYVEIALDNIKNFPGIFNKLGDLGSAYLSDDEEQKTSYALTDALQTEFMICLIEAMEEDIQKVFDTLAGVLAHDEREREQDQYGDEQELIDDDNRMRVADMNADCKCGYDCSSDYIDGIFK